MNRKRNVFTLCLSIIFMVAAIGIYIGLGSGTVKAAEFTSIARWDFDEDGVFNGWGGAHHSVVMDISGGSFNFTVTGGDPYFESPGGLDIDMDQANVIRIMMKHNTSDNKAQIFFSTSYSFSEENSVFFELVPNDSEFRVYEIDLSNNPNWTGTLTNLRFDIPNDESSGTYSIDFIEIGTYGEGGFPTAEPTEEPTEEPTQEPTEEPTAEPTAEPTEAPDDEDEDIDDQDDENDGVPQTGQDYTMPVIFAIISVSLFAAYFITLTTKKKKSSKI